MKTILLALVGMCIGLNTANAQFRNIVSVSETNKTTNTEFQIVGVDSILHETDSMRLFYSTGSNYGFAQNNIDSVQFLSEICGAADLIVSRDSFVDSRDGQQYKTITYCNGQTWMAENLNYDVPWRYGLGHFADTFITSVSPSGYLGRVYSWTVLMNGGSSSSTSPSGVQGICPSGWHVPSDAEWKSFEKTLGMLDWHKDTTGWRGWDQGAQLKSGINTLWRTNGEGTNSSGFGALPGGYYEYRYFFNVTSQACFWTSTAANGSQGDAWGRTMQFNADYVNRDKSTKNFAKSCRCVKD